MPVLGIIENMSYFLCPSCGERSDIFGHGGAEQEAARSSTLPFLGAVPLHMDIREKSDSGSAGRGQFAGFRAGQDLLRDRDQGLG